MYTYTTLPDNLSSNFFLEFPKNSVTIVSVAFVYGVHCSASGGAKTIFS